MLQIQTVEPGCLALLKELMILDELKSFRLAGGTALSLRLGHRISVDLDLFTNQLFDINEFITFLKTHFTNRIQIGGSNRYGVFTTIDDIKVDFLYRYEKFDKQEDVYEELRLAAIEDIAAMKIQAAVSRASKKDYYDLFELLNVYTFAELINFYAKMHPNHDLASTLKSLADFSETDLNENPVSLKSASWEIIKEKISSEIKGYIQQLQQKRINAETDKKKSIEKLISKKINKN